MIRGVNKLQTIYQPLIFQIFSKEFSNEYRSWWNSVCCFFDSEVGVISCSWWFVFMPLYAGFVLAILFWIFALCLTGIAEVLFPRKW